MSIWLPVPKAGSGPLYVGIADEIGRAIARGELRPGARLPTHRDLAGRMGISIHTVSQAYAEAERRGFVIGEIGRGTFVRAGHAEREARFIMDRRAADLVDLSINRPVYDHIQTERLRTTLTAMAAEDDLSSMLVCRPIAGLDAHRAAGAAWIRARGIDVDPERLVVCNGAAHGLMVALASLTRPGDIVLTEALTDHGTIGLASTLHYRLRGVPLDEEGLVPEALEALCAEADVKVLCVTPCLSNPTTALMSAGRRERIAEIVRRYGISVVENDVYGHLPASAPKPLWHWVPEQTWYVTSLTKTVVSGLRTGYLVCPAGAVARAVRRIRVTSWMATPFIAELASKWIRDGTAVELLEWQRKRLAERHAVLSDVLDGSDLQTHPHALHAWLELPEPWRSDALVAEARVRGVALTPAEPFAVGREAAPHAIRISLGAARTLDELRHGLGVLAELLRRQPEPLDLV